MMSAGQTRIAETQNKAEPVRQPKEKPVQYHRLGRLEAVAPQAAYRRAQANPNGLTASDLLALQHTVGNRMVQRMVPAAPATESAQQVLQRQPSPQGVQAVSPPPSTRAQQVFMRLEQPLQQAVGTASKLDKWDDAAVTGLVLVYNKMRNDGVWQYVKEITYTSAQVSFDFIPKDGQAELRKSLAGHGYKDIWASYRLDWGLRKAYVSGAHLHFKHFKAGDAQVNVHIDQVYPGGGPVPIISPLINILRHWSVDLRQWAKRNPEKLKQLLEKQGIPLSSHVLEYLESKGYHGLGSG